MRFPRLLALSIVVLSIAAGAAQVRAQTVSDNLLVCCAVQSAPTTCTNVVQSCTPIADTIAAINKCSGIVMGCAVGSYSCQPSTVSPGKQDCSCSSLAAVLCSNGLFIGE